MKRTSCGLALLSGACILVWIFFLTVRAWIAFLAETSRRDFSPDYVCKFVTTLTRGRQFPFFAQRRAQSEFVPVAPFEQLRIGNVRKWSHLRIGSGWDRWKKSTKYGSRFSRKVSSVFVEVTRQFVLSGAGPAIRPKRFPLFRKSPETSFPLIYRWIRVGV
jgi:hypothetical protein